MLEKFFAAGQAVDFERFLAHLQEKMGPVRRALVEEIFAAMDPDCTGQVPAQVLSKAAHAAAHFNPRTIEAVKNGTKSPGQGAQELLDLLRLTDGGVAREEFLALYDDLNINFTHNEAFVSYVSSQWKHTPKKARALAQDEVKKAVRGFRLRLLESIQGSKEELLVKKLFDRLGASEKLKLGPWEVAEALKEKAVSTGVALGVDAEGGSGARRQLPSGVAATELPGEVAEAVLRFMDKNESGYVEFDEFKKFLFHEPVFL